MTERDGIGGEDFARIPADADKCKCGNPGVNPHYCPYQYDINDDKDTLCNCCEACRGNCADDI